MKGILLIVGIIIVAIGGFYFVSQRGDNETAQEKLPSTDQQDQDTKAEEDISESSGGSPPVSGGTPPPKPPVQKPTGGTTTSSGVSAEAEKLAAFFYGCYNNCDAAMLAEIDDVFVKAKEFPFGASVTSEEVGKYFKNELRVPISAIYRGEFDTESDEEIAIFSFENPDIASCLFWIREQTFGGRKLFYDCSPAASNTPPSPEPRFLISGEDPFFLQDNSHAAGACAGVDYTKSLVQFQNNKFVTIWEESYYKDDVSGGKGVLIDLDMRFEDITEDGNIEIVLEGTERSCSMSDSSGSAFSCGECVGPQQTQKVKDIFVWDSAQGTFVPQE